MMQMSHLHLVLKLVLYGGSIKPSPSVSRDGIQSEGRLITSFIYHLESYTNGTQDFLTVR
jgi:hypothetical protein